MRRLPRRTRRGQKRPGFTLVELLVSLALILFIMSIISEVFVASTQVFRDLKSAGDMADKLRVTTAILRRTLGANHFDAGGSKKLSDGSVWQGNNPPLMTDSPPLQGFFRIIQTGQGTPEGGDNLIQVSPPGFGPPVPAAYQCNRVTTCALHFTACLPGTNMNGFFYGYAPPGSLVLSSSTGPSDTAESRYQEPTGTSPPYSCQWAEVAFFLRPVPDTANGTPLFALFMRQRLLVPATGAGGTRFLVPAGYDPTAYVEVSGAPNSTGALACNGPGDITEPPQRFGMIPGPATTAINYSGQFASGRYTTLAEDTAGNAANNQLFAGADLLMTDVVSFEVRVLPQGWSDFADVYDMANSGQWQIKNPAFTAAGTMAFDTWSQNNDTQSGFNYTGWNGGTNAGGFDAIPIGVDASGNLPRLKAVQVTLRVWDQKTNLTRQVTIVVPL